MNNREWFPSDPVSTSPKVRASQILSFTSGTFEAATLASPTLPLIIEHLAIVVGPVETIVGTGDQTLHADDIISLPYDDDPEWNASFAKSLSTLERLAAKARQDHEQGRTVELDPDEL